MESFKKFVVRFWPVLFLFAVWAAFSSPYFFLQKVPYPARYQVTFFSPWSYFQEFAGPVKNNAMPDIVDELYPWKHFTIEQLKQGQIPWWNPYSFAGTTHLANIQSTVFSPFNLFFFVLPFIDAWSIVVLLQPLLAGLFLYLFMREVSVSKLGSVISSVAFMFCGFIVVWMEYGTLAFAVLFLPLILFGIERTFQRKTWRFLPLVAFGLAFSYFSGHIQTSIYVTVVSSAYVLYKVFVTKDVKRFFLLALSLFSGFLLSLLQIIPAMELLQQSVRSNLAYQGGEIPLSYLITMFAPDFFGNPVTRNDWQGFYAERASFIGVIPLIFAFFAFVKPRRPRLWFFALVGLLAVGFASATPLRQLLLVSNLPVFATSIPSRMIVIASFSFAVLAGFGFDTLQKVLVEKRKKLVFNVLGVILVLFSVWCWSTFFQVPSEHISLAKKNIVIPAILFTLAFIFIPIPLFVKKGSQVIGKVSMIVGLVLLILMTGDSLRFALKWIPFDNRKLVYPDLPVINTLQKEVGNGRVFGNLGTQVETYYGIGSLEGYDPLYVERYGEFIRAASTGDYLPAERSVVRLDRKGFGTERVLDLLGVNVLFHPKADTGQSWAFPVWEDKKKYTMVYEDDHFQLFSNTTALPRAKLFYHYNVIQDGKQLLRKFYEKEFDFRNVLLLEENPGIAEGEVQRAKGSAKIIWYSPNKVVVAVENDQPALLFLSDAFYPHWKATINGKTAKIYRADYAFRAVPVERGKSTVMFYYDGLAQ